MDGTALHLRARLLPALLVALGVGFLTSGLLSYTQPVEAGPAPSEPPVIVTAPPTFQPTPTPRPSGETPAPSPTFPLDREATRIVIPALRIDLPVIRPPATMTYPYCDVAMFITELGQPGQGRATYIYSHARKGMFLPMLEASRIDDGVSMLGMLVQVYTSDDMLFIYEITEVRRHQIGMDDAFAASEEELWLQTSEGPKGTIPKLKLVAHPVSSGPADPAEAHPEAKPRECR